MGKSEEAELGLDEFLQKEAISSEELIYLLKKRDENQIKLLLVDIRELEENMELSIVGTDILFPISKIHLYPNVLEQLRHENVVLYCRTGSRTTYLLQVMKKMGFENVSHLKNGIVEYRGEIMSKKTPPIVY